MKPAIHIPYKQISVACSCGNNFVTGSTLNQDLKIEICAQCHPFYSGKQKLNDAAGRIDRFHHKYNHRRLLKKVS